MDPPQTRETRGRSAELDGRRINAVSPMHLVVGESVLQNLWKEKQHITSSTQQLPSNSSSMEDAAQKAPLKGGDDSERKLAMMLEKYQSQVKLQQQRGPSQGSSRNNLHKIEKMASMSRQSHPPPPVSHMSHSQPCLIAITDRPPDYSISQPMSSHQYQRRSSGSGSGEHHDVSSNGISTQRIPNNQKLMQSLRDQNVQLNREVETLRQKLAKLMQIENAYERIERDYDNLLRDKERQETMEKNALAQIEMHLRRAISEKDMIQERFEQLQMTMSALQMQRTNTQINEELKAYSERQKLEINAQNTTLEEQRKHISIMENALTNAQERLTKKEEAYEKLVRTAEMAKLLQRQLQEVLIDKQARDEAHAHERAQWEMEVTQLRLQINKETSLNGSLKRTGRLSSDEDTVTRLKKTIHAKDERITQLEKAVADLQEKLHDESQKRYEPSSEQHLEAKIAHLQEQKNDKERRLAELAEQKVNLVETRGLLSYPQDESTRNLEDLRQKIQERRRKGRIGATGGLIGVMSSDHSRSSSGSLPHSNHQRTSSDGPLEPSYGSGRLHEMYQRGFEPNGNNYTTSVSFRDDTKAPNPHDHNNWNV